MDIKNILDSLGLDLSNPEIKRGAIEAINAILDSRIPPPDLGSGSFGGGSGSSGGEAEEVELDPNLLQPSKKHQPPVDTADIEIEDDEDVLSQIKHNESDDDFDNNAAGQDSTSTNQSSNTNSSSNDDSNSASSDSSSSNDTSDSSHAEANSNSEEDELNNNTEKPEENKDSSNTVGDSEDSEEAGEENAEEPIDSTEDNDTENGESGNGDLISADEENSDDMLSDEELSDDEFEFDEDDFLDDDIKNNYEDENIKTKQDARKIKRERTLLAAKKALDTARNKKTSASLIHELEKAIEALEALTEAVTKSLKEISDDEFNLLVNRVFDAIEALGDSELTYTTDAERELQAQEIKADLSSARTQQELSAEDVAQIRAETQTIQARERETQKYQRRASSSFKGFQEFLNSLYRAIALQVKTNELQDDSWSAINRRYVDSGVLQPGKRITELPDRKIPIIDFYFDCSSSWTGNDIAVGKKAAAALADMEEKGQIKINLYYFGDEVSSEYNDVRGQATSGWNEIVKNVIATQATNVIIMTDDDMENWWEGDKALTYTVPGYVWYLWKNGQNAPRLPRDLKGRGGTQQFSFSSNDA
jgi:hypothetical protein